MWTVDERQKNLDYIHKKTTRYQHVPKDLLKNLMYRQEILSLCLRDNEAKAMIRQMCREDILFYINTFCWTYDPRFSEYYKKEVPFITYDYQDVAILRTVDAIREGHDILTEKSRDMGASWVYLVTYEWFWKFHPMNTFLALSRIEDLVDKTGDPDCLFWKIDYLQSKQPKWLVPRIERTKLHIGNLDNGSTIEGGATTGSAGRGGRKTSILLDEFADVSDGLAMLSSTGDATRCRVFNSTYKGAGNAFFEVSKWDHIEKLTFHWSMHPDKSVGLYRVTAGKVEIIDVDYHSKHPGYVFVLEHGYYDGLHSPWYDYECTRRTVQEIKEQLDIDPHGSGATFFDYKTLDMIMDAVCVESLHKGNIAFVKDAPAESPEFFPDRHGLMELWIPIGLDNIPLKKYDASFGVDISSGTGASNSVIVAYDNKTKEKLLQFVCPTLKPYELARYGIALAYWLNDEDEGQIIWESTGPGREFGSTLQEYGYNNLYFRTRDESMGKKESDIPGFYPSADTKKQFIGIYRRSLETGEIKNYSKRAVMECKEYIYDKSGGVKHSRQIRLDDPSGARDNHGDIVIADALAAKLLNENYTEHIYLNSKEIEEPEVERNSPEERRLAYLKSLTEDRGWNN